MRPATSIGLVAAFIVPFFAFVIGQVDAQGPPAAQAPPAPALKETVAQEIPGVIRGGYEDCAPSRWIHGDRRRYLDA